MSHLIGLIALLWFLPLTHSSSSYTVHLFEHANQQGYSGVYSGATCHNLCPGRGCRLNDAVSSVNTAGTCVQLFEHINCYGASLRLESTTEHHNNLVEWDFNDKVSSIGPCATFAHRLSRRDKRIHGLPNNWPVIMDFGPPENTELLDLDISGRFSIEQVALARQPRLAQRTRGQYARLEWIRAQVWPRHLGGGTGVTGTSRDRTRVLGRAGDQAGHAIARNLGGRGVWYNIFPQNAHLNMGEWAQAERAIARDVRETQRPANIVIRFLFDGNSGRPVRFYYYATTRRRCYSGMVENP